MQNICRTFIARSNIREICRNYHRVAIIDSGRRHITMMARDLFWCGRKDCFRYDTGIEEFLFPPQSIRVKVPFQNRGRRRTGVVAFDPLWQ